MTRQTNLIAISSIAIGALAWVDPLFIPLVLLGPPVSGLVAGIRRVRPRIVAIPWFCGGLLMLISDLLINQEDVAFHGVVAVLTALVAAGSAIVARRCSRRRFTRRSVPDTLVGLALAVAGLVAAGTLLGCGDGASPTSNDGSQAPALSKTEFIARANAICRQADRRLNQAARGAYPHGEPTPAQAENFLGQHVIPEIEAEVARIRALPAPVRDRERVAALLDATEQGAQEAKANPDLLQEHGRRDPLYRGIRLAGQYGLTDCARQ